MRFTSILFTCVLCFLEAKSSNENSLETSNESVQSETLSNESGLSISMEFQSSESIGNDSEGISNESGSSITFEEESEDVSNDSSGISFELQSAEEPEDVSYISKDPSDASFSSVIVKYGVIDNDQVYCSWEDVDARDEMATKLGTQLCRFSMASFNTVLTIQ